MKNIFLSNFFKYFFVFIFIFLCFFLIKNSFGHSIFKQTLDTQITFQENKIKFVKIAGKVLKVDVVSSFKEKEKGLSGRENLREDEGMLFIFDHMDKYSFWMKEMHFPIDIIWIGEDFKVVYVKEKATPESYPEAFSPNKNAKYVLEVFSGFSEKNNLKIGNSIEFLSP